MIRKLKNILNSKDQPQPDIPDILHHNKNGSSFRAHANYLVKPNAASPVSYLKKSLLQIQILINF